MRLHVQSTRSRLLLALALAAVPSLAAAGSADGSAGNPRASAARACNISGHERSYGPSYVTYIGVSGGATCSQAGREVRAYYRCRLAHGGVSGHCAGVQGFHCSEQRFNGIAEYQARVRCSRGRERIRHDYTQFT